MSLSQKERRDLNFWAGYAAVIGAFFGLWQRDVFAGFFALVVAFYVLVTLHEFTSKNEQ